MDTTVSLFFSQRSVSVLTLAVIGLVIVISLAVSGTKTKPSRILITFFSMLTLAFSFGLVPIEQEIVFLYPIFAVFTLIEINLLIRFAYAFPERPPPGEKKPILIVSHAGLLLVSLITLYLIGAVIVNWPRYPLLYSILFSIMPLYVLLAVVVFLRQGAVTRSATLKTFALALVLAIFPVSYPLVNFSWMAAYPYVSLAATIVIMFTMLIMFLSYLERREEPVSLSVKMISVTLCGFLIFCGSAGIIIAQWLANSYEQDRILEAAAIMHTVGMDMTMDQAPAGVIYILSIPSIDPPSMYGARVLFSRTADISTYLDRLEPRRENQNSLFASLRPSNPFIGTYAKIEKVLYYAGGVQQASPLFVAYRFETDSGVYEIGYPFRYYSSQTNEAMKNLIGIILGGSLLIILSFLLYYERTLIKPLQAILLATRQASRGETDVHIPALPPDEIGTLAKAFNDFLRVIKNANQALIEANQTLERRVEERTADLELLRHVATSLNQSVTIEEALQTGLQTVMSLLNARSGWIYLINEDQTPRLGVAYNLPGEEQIHRHLQEYTSCECINRMLSSDFHSAEFFTSCPVLPGHLSIPLRAGSTAYGTLNLLLPADKQTSENEIRLYTTIGQSFSASIDRARLFDAEREQRNVAETLREIGIRLGSTLEMEQILDELLNLITRLIPHDTGNLMLISGDWASISRLRGYEKFGEEIAQKARFRSFRISDTKNLRKIIETKKPHIIADVKADPDWVEYGMSTHIRSWIGAPIIAHDEIIAIFSLDKTTPNYYRRIHLDRLVAFSAQAGLALENARLYARLREELNREQRFHQLTQAFSTGLDFKSTLQEAVRLAMEILNADAGALSLLSEDSKEMVSAHSINMPPVRSDVHTPGGIYIKKEEGIAWETVRSRKSLLIDLEQNPEQAPHLADVGVRSMISVPVLAGENILGALGIFSFHEMKQFTARDLAFTENIGRQTGIAIQNLRLFEELHRLAITDTLTGIYNRGQFFNLGVIEMERSSRYQHFLSAVMLDIDHFKQVNDTHGHGAGDQVLQEIARRCNAIIRKVDILGRYGGEEFAILLPETDLASAVQMAERLREDIEARPFNTQTGLHIPITASLGVSSILPQVHFGANHVSQLETLLTQADEAMYDAKRSGRNLVRVFKPVLKPT